MGYGMLILSGLVGSWFRQGIRDWNLWGGYDHVAAVGL